MRAEIRSRLAGYISEAVSLRDFQDWLIPETWDVRHLDSETLDLVRDVQLSLAEYSGGDITEQELRRDFALLLVGDEPARATSGMSNITVVSVPIESLATGAVCSAHVEAALV
jgi:hypothetical protein